MFGCRFWQLSDRRFMVVCSPDVDCVSFSIQGPGSHHRQEIETKGWVLFCKLKPFFASRGLVASGFFGNSMLFVSLGSAAPCRVCCAGLRAWAAAYELQIHQALAKFLDEEWALGLRV